MNAASAPASSGWRSSACPCWRGASPRSRRRPWCACARCPPMCRSTTWRAAGPPTCRCACRPWCAARRCSTATTRPSASHRPASANSDDEEAAARQDARVIADKLPLTLNKDGAGKVTIDNVPQARQPQELLLEATYADPNGEVQTIRSTQALWPAGVVAGIKTEGWVSARQKIRYQALALQHNGKPAADTSLQVQAIARITT